MLNRHINLLLLLHVLIYTIAYSLHADNASPSIDIDRVKEDPTFSKRVSGFTLSVTPFQMNYVLDNLPYASLLLNEYGVHTLRIRTVGINKFHAADESGLEGAFRLIENGYYHREYAGNGWIKSRVIPRISADVVTCISFRETDQGAISNDLELWVSVDSVILDLLCRIFQPILLQILTKKFDHFISVVQQLIEKIQENPDAAAMILLKHGATGPEVEEFRSVFTGS